MTEGTLNADPAELAKFSDLAHRWWDTESEFRPLHEMNPLRLAWIEGQAGLAGKQVLDVGCGGGILADSMARRGATCWASTWPPRRCAWRSCTPWRPTRPTWNTAR
jgi:2-polyprenyl-6-hydroxyphenyl methylase/3-demethylubiquinone-9 3-methyltransferase